jgi:dipeptidyl aminopeptidase/acylaminoacyl peptidase
MVSKDAVPSGFLWNTLCGKRSLTMSARWRLAAVGVLAVGWAGSAAAKLPPLIPREILFGNPERTSPQISPDGKYLTYLAPDKNNVLQVWIRSLGRKNDRVLTADKKRGIRNYFWTYDGEQLIYLQDSDGDENFHLYAVNIKTNVVRDLTPFQGVKAELVGLEPKFPREVLVGLNLKKKRKFDVYRVNLKNGAVEFDTENPGNIIAWTADANFKVRAAVAATADGGFDLLFREAPGKKWQKSRHWGPDEEGQPIGFSEDSKTLYVLANHDSETLRLLAVELENEKETVLAEDQAYDLGAVFLHPTKKTIQAVAVNKDKVTWKVLDDSIKGAFARLAKLHKGQFRVADRDLEDKTWLVSYTTDDGPVYYYSYDRDTKKGKLLFSSQPKLEKRELAAMQPISFKSRDGLTVHGYLTTPVGVPARKLPTVLLVHGGPWARDSWGFNPMVQWLANRGYAVLQVNYRGSTGYGKKFHNAGDREWAGKMHNDLIDAVNWVVAKRVADKKKVAIMGGSFGGYATLVGLTFTPDVFAAGVDLVGPSSLITLFRTIPPYWASYKAMFAKRVGNPEKEEEFLKSRSPLFFVSKIKAPLLIGQGANDPRVKQSESDQIVAQLRKLKKPVDYLVYTDEGHGFARPENRLHFFAKAEEFLAKYLGGRAEPASNVKGHSGVIK